MNFSKVQTMNRSKRKRMESKVCDNVSTQGMSGVFSGLKCKCCSLAGSSIETEVIQASSTEHSQFVPQSYGTTLMNMYKIP